MDFSEAAYTNRLSEIDMSGNSGSSDVEPVGGLGRKFVGVRGLDGINPACDAEISFYGSQTSACTHSFVYIPTKPDAGHGDMEGRVGLRFR